MDSALVRTPATKPPHGDATARPLVWIVDDSPLEAEAVRRALAAEFETEIFPDGSAVLERSVDSPPPDVLVLDWVMPGVSGIDVCRFLRSERDQLPVLLLTVHKDKEHLAEGLGAGANDFLSKPFSPLELTARVRALVATRRMHEIAERAERERAEAQRLRADAAEERVRLGELFLGVIGHDLRSPLAAITMAATALVVRPGDADTKKLAEGIRSTSRRMGEMIATLLDVTRLRLGGGLQVHPTSNDLRQMCRQLVDELTTAFPGRQIHFDATEEPIHLDFDLPRMGQVLSNLVSNALLHGDPNTPVRIDVGREPGEVRLRVTNHGAPIPPLLVAHLFDPFRRGPSPNAGPGGLGLGLYITQQIVAAHGGSIEVSSGEVTVFTVRLPA